MFDRIKTLFQRWHEIKEADALRVLMKDLAAEQLEYEKYRRPGSGSLTG